MLGDKASISSVPGISVLPWPPAFVAQKTSVSSQRHDREHGFLPSHTGRLENAATRSAQQAKSASSTEREDKGAKSTNKLQS